MLERLPFEVFQQVTLKLNRHDISNLCSAFPTLKDNIQKYHMFETLDLRISKKRRRDLIKKLKRQNRCSNVKRIIFNSSDISPEVLNALPLNFKRITEIYNMSEDTDISIPSLIGWKDTLKQYDSPARQQPLLPLINNNIFSKINTLCISLNNRNGETARTFDISILKNLPSLSKLTICKSDITISTFEDLHDKSPALSNLILTSVSINTSSHTPSRSVSSHTSMTSLCINGRSSLNDSKACFNGYLPAKYPNLESLTLLLDITTDNNQENVFLDSQSKLLSGLDSTKSLNVTPFATNDIMCALKGSKISRLTIKYNGAFATEDSVSSLVFKSNHIDNFKIHANATSLTNNTCIEDVTNRIDVFITNHKTLQRPFLKEILNCFPEICSLSIDEKYSFYGNAYSMTPMDPYLPLVSLSITSWIASFLSNRDLNAIFPSLKRLRWTMPNNCKPASIYYLLSNIDLRILDLDTFRFQLKFDFKKQDHVNYTVNIHLLNSTRVVVFTLLEDSTILNITTTNSPPDGSNNVINIYCDNINSIIINDEYHLC